MVGAHHATQQCLDVGENGRQRASGQEPRRSHQARGRLHGLDTTLRHQGVREHRDEQQHRHREVATDHRGVEQLPYRERTQQHLDREQRHRHQRQASEPRPQRGSGERPSRDPEDREAHQQGNQTMEPLDHDVELERRYEPALTQRPVGTRQPRAGGTHDRADDDQREDEERRGEPQARRDAEGTSRGQWFSCRGAPIHGRRRPRRHRAKRERRAGAERTNGGRT